MTWGGNWFADKPPSGPPCRILPDPDSYRYCNQPSGTRTALDFPICDECFNRVKETSAPED